MANLNDLYPSKYIKAADLGGQTHSVTIDRLDIQPMPDGKKKPVLYFKAREKGLVLNKTNATTIGYQFGNDTNLWRGERIDLFATRVSGPNGMVDGIRVRPVSRQAAPPAAGVAPAPVNAPLNDRIDDIGGAPAPF
jgi:hypothetical protein